MKITIKLFDYKTGHFCTEKLTDVSELYFLPYENKAEIYFKNGNYQSLKMESIASIKEEQI